MTKTRLLLPPLLVLAAAACSDKKLYPDAEKAFERHSYQAYAPGEVRKALEARGFAGLAALDPEAALVESKRGARQMPARESSSSGLLFSGRGGQLRVVKVFRDSPAAAAGVQDGDVALELDGSPASPGAAADKVPGSFGYSLALSRRGARLPAAAQLARERFVPPVVFGFYDPASRTAFVKIGMFFKGSAATASAGIQGLSALGARKLVLDLRGNMGGLPDEAAALLAEFAPRHGPVLEMRSRHPGYSRVFEAKARGKFSGLKVAVLTDGDTLMAAEVFAQAMKDLSGAVLVGGRTGGKVSVTRTFSLGSGRKGLVLTVARLLPPSGLDLHREGLRPDVDAGLSREEEREVKSAWDAGLETVLLFDKAYALAGQSLAK